MTPNEIGQLAINAVLIGGAVGFLRWGQVQNSKDISQIKKALGLENGGNGSFVRRTEWELDRYARDREIEDLRERLSD